MTKYIALGVCCFLIVADIFVKGWAITGLSERITVIPGLFYLTYVENRGAAFGILQGKSALLAVVSGVVLLSAIIAMLANRVREKYLIWCMSLIIAGGTGNLIDRVTRGYVVDYLDFSALFNFPVFNLADCCIVSGTILLVLRMIYLDRLSSKKGREEADDHIKEA